MSETHTLIRQRYAAMAPGMISALSRRGFEAYFCATAAEAADKLVALIPENDTVSWGGSLTLEESGALAKVRSGKFQVLDRDSVTDPEARRMLMRQALLCGTYLSSVNAMSEDGIMVNIDGNCNRIAAIAFGPERVILMVGMNKICRDLAAARHRARTFAAPANGFRFNADLPCTKTGFCHDCVSPQCMCCQIVEMRRNRIPGRIKIILVGEDLGL